MPWSRRLCGNPVKKVPHLVHRPDRKSQLLVWDSKFGQRDCAIVADLRIEQRHLRRLFHLLLGVFVNLAYFAGLLAAIFQ